LIKTFSLRGRELERGLIGGIKTLKSPQGNPFSTKSIDFKKRGKLRVTFRGDFSVIS